jgi:cytochrome b561
MTTAVAAWSLSTRLLHWIGAAAILFMLALGFAMVNLIHEQGLRFDLYQFHKSLGLFVLTLMAVRGVWRFARPTPAPIGTIPAWQNRAAKAMHAALYALAIATALAGYAAVSTSSLPLPVALPFGLHAPNLLGPEEALSGRLRQAHHVFAALLAICVAGHVGAALKHHFIDGDATLVRMRPY